MVLHLAMDPAASASRGGFGEERYEKLEFQKQVRTGVRALENEVRAVQHAVRAGQNEVRVAQNGVRAFQQQSLLYEL